MANPKLNQIVAVEKGVKNGANKTFTDAYHVLQREAAFNGMTRTYQPREEGGDELPAEATKVQVDIGDVFHEVREALTKAFDVMATKDYGNTVAKADVVVDGDVVIAQAPPTFLLTLEKYLNDLKTVIIKAPVLDPAVDWSYDAATGQHRSAPVKTSRTRKDLEAKVLYPHTDRHPAQVESFTVDHVIGDYTTTKFSSALTVERRNELTDNVDTLLQAVKFAREEANNTAVERQKVGEAIFTWVFDDGV